jgi:CRP-like cAMP-binding protein
MVRRMKAGADIVREHDRPSQCCLVLSGWLCRYKLLPGGKRQILSVHIPGDIPDLHSLHLTVMDHNLGTLTAGTVGFLPHNPLRELCRANPRLAALLWRETLIDSSVFREWMVGLGRRTAYARIAHLMCEFYLRLQSVGLAEDWAFELPLTQVQLADALGLSAVHVNRSLKELRADGLIVQRGNLVTIPDWGALNEAAEFDPTYLHLNSPHAAGRV